MKSEPFWGLEFCTPVRVNLGKHARQPSSGTEGLPLGKSDERQDQTLRAAIRRDAVQLVRCARHGNPQMRNKILADYGVGEHDHPIADLLIHLAYFVHELIEDNPDLESDWLDIRLQNLVCGPHEDAHRFVFASYEGAWDEFHEHVDEYTADTPEQPEPPATHGREDLNQLVWELAYLGNSTHRTEPSCYKNWPEDFYQAHFELGEREN